MKNKDKIHIFGNKKRLKEFISIISKFEHQLDFFDLESPEYLLEQIKELYENQRPYQKWNQFIGTKERHLAVPNPIFKKFINLYLLPLIKKVECHSNAHGGEKYWSPKKSLETLLPCRTVFSFDLASAFDNVNAKKVFDFFYKHPLFDQNNKEDFSLFLSDILTVDYHGNRVLPQGAPHSVALFNRIFYDLDVVLDKKTNERGFNYVRWIDDITISSSENLELRDFLGALKLVEEYTSIAKNKVFFQKNPKPIYLLGQTIEGNRIFKNSKEEREENKQKPLDYNVFLNSPNSW